MTRALACILAAVLLSAGALWGQSQPVIPAFWDAELLHDCELPLATPGMSPTHVSRDYYYALPERPLFKSFPIYHPDREPAGYLDRLRAVEPEQVFDATSLTTDADWIAAGKLVFELPIYFGGPIVSLADVRDAKWYARHRVPIANDGTMPFARYVVREKGKVEVGNLACAMCHTRVMPDGRAILGAQGNFPLDPIFSTQIAGLPPPVLPLVINSLVAAPWDAEGSARLKAMTPVHLQPDTAAEPDPRDAKADDRAALVAFLKTL